MSRKVESSNTSLRPLPGSRRFPLDDFITMEQFNKNRPADYPSDVSAETFTKEYHEDEECKNVYPSPSNAENPIPYYLSIPGAVIKREMAGNSPGIEPLQGGYRINASLVRGTIRNFSKHPYPKQRDVPCKKRRQDNYRGREPLIKIPLVFEYNHKSFDNGSINIPPRPALLPYPMVNPEISHLGRKAVSHTPPMIVPNIIKQKETWLTSSVQARNISDSLIVKSNECSSDHVNSTAVQMNNFELKSVLLDKAVGKSIFETENVILTILQWNPYWLDQQDLNDQPPPICARIKKVMNVYEDIDQYYNTFFPLMLLETWQRIYSSWKNPQLLVHYDCDILSYSQCVVNDPFTEVLCKAGLKSSKVKSQQYPEEGHVIMVTFGTKQKVDFKILGYVREVEINPLSLSDKDASGGNTHLIVLRFSCAYRSRSFDFDQKIRIQVLYNIKKILKQNHAILDLKNSPFCNKILNPSTKDLQTLIITSKRVKINENVDEIRKAVYDTPASLILIEKYRRSDRSCIIPLLLEKTKNYYGTKVLLCTGDAETLNDYARLFRMKINFVVLGKKADIHSKIRKYWLEEIASAKLNEKLNEIVEIREPRESESDLLRSIKLDILKNSDLVLCELCNCHNDLLAEAFADGDSNGQMCCIIDDAHSFTETEILVTLLHRFAKLILIGVPKKLVKLRSKTAIAYGFNRSFFQRVHALGRRRPKQLGSSRALLLKGHTAKI